MIVVYIVTHNPHKWINNSCPFLDDDDDDDDDDDGDDGDSV